MDEHQETASLVSRFLQSKKALAQGQFLCSHASELNAATVSVIVDALAFESKAKWLSEGVTEQLNLAATISRLLGQQRSKCLEEARGWDILRSERSQSLDAILENLGLQLVPPNLHLMSSGSSLFGSQVSLHDPIATQAEETPRAGSSSTADARSKWKTLRDFVDEKGIEDALERMEADRIALDDILNSTASHPTALNKHVADIKAAVPELRPPPRSVEALLLDQDGAVFNMARALESLTSHFDNMTQALRDEESGHPPTEDELRILIPDANELPHALSELESSMQLIQSISDQSIGYRDDARNILDFFGHIIQQLESLESILDLVLEDHANMQNDAADAQAALESHHASLKELEGMYHSYQFAYDHLILEMDRRARYRQEVEGTVAEMTTRLESLRQDEVLAREKFILDHGNYLPEDLCPYIPDQPVKYVLERDGSEGTVTLSKTVVLEAKRNLGIIEEEVPL